LGDSEVAGGGLSSIGLAEDADGCTEGFGDVGGVVGGAVVDNDDVIDRVRLGEDAAEGFRDEEGRVIGRDDY